MRRFIQRLQPTADSHILDIGGYPATWQNSGVPSHVHIINLNPIPYSPREGFPPIETAVADGCALPYPDNSFDIVFSNSVIEHVGTRERQKAFAYEARRLGRKLWIQTPARWFFIEPHLIAPFIHFLPLSVQQRLLRYFTPWGWLTRPTPEQVKIFLAEVRLLTYREVKELFPDCTILRERFFGMTKSYIAVRS
jgi:SAM-dependent methyltransferase